MTEGGGCLAYAGPAAWRVCVGWAVVLCLVVPAAGAVRAAGWVAEAVARLAGWGGARRGERGDSSGRERGGARGQEEKGAKEGEWGEEGMVGTWGERGGRTVGRLAGWVVRGRVIAWVWRLLRGRVTRAPRGVGTPS